MLLNFLFQWRYVILIAIIWLVIDFAWVSRWETMTGRLSKLLSAPWVFAKDAAPAEIHPLYPREFWNN